jgi:outer membrane lipoprotein-sorting protein
VARILLTIALLVPSLASCQDDALLMRIWNGVQAAQTKYTSACGTVTETRTSALLARPLVFHGKFCAQGMNRFSLEYAGPETMRLRFNQDYLNVTTGPSGATKTEVLEVGEHVRRTQAYFSKANSIENLKHNFTITAQEHGDIYEMKLVPRSARFGNRINFIVVKLLKDSFLLSSIEVNGKSGVDSVFEIKITELNPKINEEMFSVYKPK